MRTLQAEIISEMGVKPTINPAEEVERRIQFLMDYTAATHTRGYVLGISGGLDSTVAGRLAQLATEGMPDATFVAVRLPSGIQQDEAEAQAAMDFINATRPVTINIGDAVAALAADYEKGMGEPLTDFNKGNVKARMRMIAQYAIGGDHGLLTIGTDHAAESTVGFFTKFGDGGADILPLYGLNKRQIRSLARELGAPDHLVNKVPTADLLDGQPGRADEDELGISYEHIDDYLEGKDIPDAVAEKIETMYLRSRHKRTTPVTVFTDWWRN